MLILLIIFLVIAGFWLFVRVITIKRKKVIKEILADLDGLKNESVYYQEHQFAVDENIRFFKATSSLAPYFFWLFRYSSFLHQNREKLMELMDFPLPRWEYLIQKQFAWAQRLKFPGINKFFIQRLVQEIDRVYLNQESVVLMDTGCGSFEVGSQVLAVYQKQLKSPTLVFVGIDKSSLTFDLIEQNLKNRNVLLKELGELNHQVISDLRQEALVKHKTIFAFWQGSVLSLDQHFELTSCDILYYTRLRHHLSVEQRLQLDRVTKKIAPLVLEMDDMFSWPMLFFPSLLLWFKPACLNCAILSGIKDPDKHGLELKDQAKTKVGFSIFGAYVKMIDNGQDINKI